MLTKEQIVEKMSSAKESSGVGYYEVYILEDLGLVIKSYQRIDDYIKDVRKHNDLDQHNLLPKMYNNFEHRDRFIIVVEKVRCFDEEVLKEVNNPEKGYDNQYFSLLEERVEDGDFHYKVVEYQRALTEFGYTLFDIHGGNFGESADGTFVCLDEGCLVKF